MALKLNALVWDTPDPLRLARFWASALDWEIGNVSDGEVELTPTDGTGFTLLFGVTTDLNVNPYRVHPDLSSGSEEDQRKTVARLVDLGAREIDIGQGPDAGHVVLADPDNNPFCVLEPGNKFVSYKSRLGSLTCAGTRAVGLFWSEALGWPLVWDQNEETAIRDPGGAGQLVTWGGPPIPPKVAKNRLHFDVAPPADGDQAAEVERVLSLGATPVDIGQRDVPWVVLADPDDNEFCILAAR